MRWPRGLQGGLTVDLEQLEIIYAQQWSSVASEIEATELHCTKPTADGDEDTAHGGAVGACQSVYWRGAGLTLDWR
jgi:hypothetical protein